MRTSALLSSFAVLLAACASADRPAGGEPPAARERPASPAAPSENTETLRGYWRLFLEEDRAWPAARERWLAMERGDAWILVENLLFQIVRSSDRGDARSLSLARSELASMPGVAVPYLVEALGEGDNVTRRHIADVLVMTGKPAAAALVERLGRYGPEARTVAISALGAIGDASAIPALSDAAFSDRDWSARAEAVESLSVFVPSPEAEAPLARVLESDTDAFVRRRAAAALARGSSAESVAALRKALRDVDANVRASASNALSARGVPR